MEKKNRIRLFFEQVSNRVYKTAQTTMSRARIYFSGLAAISTVDESKVNYYLARALMDGSVITDHQGNRYGSDYVLASAFAAPVVNSTTAIMLANEPSLTLTEETDAMDDFNSTVQKWYKENQSTLFNTIAASQSEGDAYIYIKDTFDAQGVQLLPEYVEKIVDPVDYTTTLGYQVTSVSKKYDGKGNVVTNEYRTIYRKQYPYKIVIKLKGDGEKTDTIIEVDNTPTQVAISNPALYMEALSTTEDYKELFDTVGRFEERPLPIVHIHFNKKPQAVYGESVFRNLYIYFLNYHRVLESMLRNTVFNLVSVPYIKGIDDVEKFLDANGEEDEDGEKRLNLDPNRILFGGDKFEIKMLQTPDGVITAASIVLEKLFYLIIQASETPEFFFGTAVKSSRASVKEQLPIVVNKAHRYQNLYTQQMIELFQTIIYYKSKNGDVTVDPKLEFDFSWGTISLDDIDSITKLVDALDSRELITDETKAKILGLNKYVSDIKKEIGNARQEIDDRGLSIDQKLVDASEKEAQPVDPQEEDSLVTVN